MRRFRSQVYVRDTLQRVNATLGFTQEDYYRALSAHLCSVAATMRMQYTPVSSTKHVRIMAAWLSRKQHRPMRLTRHVSRLFGRSKKAATYRVFAAGSIMPGSNAGQPLKQPACVELTWVPYNFTYALRVETAKAPKTLLNRHSGVHMTPALSPSRFRLKLVVPGRVLAILVRRIQHYLKKLLCQRKTVLLLMITGALTCHYVEPRAECGPALVFPFQMVRVEKYVCCGREALMVQHTQILERISWYFLILADCSEAACPVHSVLMSASSVFSSSSSGFLAMHWRLIPKLQPTA